MLIKKPNLLNTLCTSWLLVPFIISQVTAGPAGPALEQFIDIYNHTLTSDFNQNGENASYFPGHPMLWDISSFPRPKNQITFESRVKANAISLSGDGTFFAASQPAGEIHIYDISDPTNRYLICILHQLGEITNIAFNPRDSNVLVVSSSFNEVDKEHRAVRKSMVKVWDLGREKVSGEVEVGAGYDKKWDVTNGESGQMVYVGTDGSSSVLQEIDQHPYSRHSPMPGSLSQSSHPPQYAQSFLAGFGSKPFSEDGSLLYVLSRNLMDHTISAVSIQTGVIKFTLQHDGPIMWVGSSPNSKFIASSSWDGTIKIWDFSTGHLEHTLHTGSQNWAGAISPDSKLIAVGSGDHFVYVWDLETGEEVAKLGGFIDWSRTLGFNPDGTLLAVGSAEGIVKMFDVSAEGGGKCIQYWHAEHGTPNDHRTWFPGHLEIEELAVSPSFNYVAFAVPDGRIVVYNYDKNKKWELVPAYRQNTKRSEGFGPFVFGGDGNILISADLYGTVRFWDLKE